MFTNVELITVACGDSGRAGPGKYCVVPVGADSQ